MDLDRRRVALAASGVAVVAGVAVAVLAVRREAPRGSPVPSFTAFHAEAFRPGKAEVVGVRAAFAQANDARHASFMRSSRLASPPLAEADAERLWDEFIQWFALASHGSRQEWGAYYAERSLAPPAPLVPLAEVDGSGGFSANRSLFGATIDEVTVTRRAVRGQRVADAPAHPTAQYKNEVAGRRVDVGADRLEACEVRVRGLFRGRDGNECRAEIGFWLVRWPSEVQWHPWGTSIHALPDNASIDFPTLP